MSSIFLIIGIVLVAVPLLVMIGFATFIFIAFMKDDGMTKGIMITALFIMAIGGFFIAGHFISQAV